MNLTIWIIIGVVAIIGTIFVVGRRYGKATTDRSRLRKIIKDKQENEKRQKQFDKDVEGLTRECHKRIPLVINRVQTFLKSRNGKGV